MTIIYTSYRINLSNSVQSATMNLGNQNKVMVVSHSLCIKKQRDLLEINSRT